LQDERFRPVADARGDGDIDAAGLVSVRGERRKLYGLRAERVGALSAGLERFLRG